MLIDLQRAMVSACYGDPAGYAGALPHLAPASIAVDKALFIHTATVTAALTQVLAEAYPSIKAGLGDQAFADAARRHLRHHPPGPPMLSAYGHGFGTDMPFPLPLLAQLDWAAHQAYFAGDTGVVTMAALASLPPDTVAGLRLRPVPSATGLTGSRSVLVDWQVGRPDIRLVEPILPLQGPDATALVWRGPDLLVAATLLPADVGNVIAALAAGNDLLTAANHLVDGSSLAPVLALLFTQGLISATDDDLTPC
ncbi:hypothetical protein CHU95_16225 [Niveispirillum lacus]|uniref:Putative DNA-binding domain-containing protein n=1 Tax=Niveispirillum lacus TaxID=1981099 RepID=A0A255YVA3_9PROT|nr:DNA-binding domain-containing protein [Niveispirillum lacus]OYQ32350.1 hypothetical protein CHU95_16225 [Niveispirillum lacus]